MAHEGPQFFGSDALNVEAGLVTGRKEHMTTIGRRRAEVLGVLLLLVWACHRVHAQTPLLDQLDQQLLAIAFDAYATSQQTCEAQPDTRHARKLSAYVEEMLKVKYPGYAIDWPNKRLMVRK
jgi:hypothetical protein